MYLDKNILIAIFFLIFNQIGFAQTFEGRVRVEIKTNKGCKYVEYDLQERVANAQSSLVNWSGLCKNGYINGKGILTIDRPNGDQNEINTIYSMGLENGEGTSVNKSANGVSKFEGLWSDGMKIQGKLYFTSSNGIVSIYEGIFKNGKYHGKGIYTIVNGNTISGDFYEGKVQGEGSIKYADGSEYIGILKDSLPNGLGKTVYKNGSIHSGSYKAGRRSGFGKLITSDGNIYEGTFDNGSSHGKGVLRFSNGDIYEGEFFMGSRTGLGTYKWANGNLFEGSFKDGALDYYGTYRYPNGDKADGKYENGKMVGRWTTTKLNGDIFYAEYENGVRLSIIPDQNNSAQIQEKRFNDIQKNNATINCNMYAQNMMSGQKPNVVPGSNASISFLSAILEGTRMNMDRQSYFDKCMAGYGY